MFNVSLLNNKYKCVLKESVMIVIDQNVLKVFFLKIDLLYISNNDNFFLFIFLFETT